MQGKSRVSSAIKYDCLKLGDSGNCIEIMVRPSLKSEVKF